MHDLILIIALAFASIVYTIDSILNHKLNKSLRELAKKNYVEENHEDD